MAWTEPAARQTGDLITADIWNTDVVDNLLALRSGNFHNAYDSGWFAVTYNTEYQKTHGLAATPRLMLVLWASTANATEWHLVTAVVHSGTALRGAALYPSPTAVRVRTGNDPSAGAIATPAASSGGGYYRILAWE